MIHTTFRGIVEQIAIKILIVVIILYASSTFTGFFLKGPYRPVDLLFLWLPAYVVFILGWSVAQWRAIQRAKTWGERFDLAYVLNFETLKYLPPLSRWVTPVLILGAITAVARLEWSAATVLFALLVYRRFARHSEVSEGKQPAAPASSRQP